MSISLSTRIGLAALEQAVSAADPSALLVAPRILRRVIKHDRRLTGIWLQVPHRKTYVVAREPLLEIVDRGELGLRWNDELPPRVILIAAPTVQALDESTADVVLLKHWRLLFHARIHVALEDQIDQGRLSVPVVRRLIDRIGQAQFDEVRNVLRQENFLVQPRDEAAVFIEFAAVYLELRYFAATLLHCYFPSLGSYDRIDEILADFIDAPRIFSETRLVGAPDPELRILDLYDEPQADDDDEEHIVPIDSPSRAEWLCQQMVRRADRAAALGNVVRAAILRMRASRQAESGLSVKLRNDARADLGVLARRLREAVGLPDEDLKPLKQSFAALLDKASRGVWSAEARLLYDLQKVCVDHERNIYSLDVVEWVLRMGKVPIKRPLPSQREVLISKHLRTAMRRLTMVRIPTSARDLVAQLLHKVVARAEDNLRDHFRPQIAEALDSARLRPADVPERVARDKLIEELLDRIVQRGFVTMGDLRDILSRNNLKLPDLSGGLELVAGDPLLVLDRTLSRSLDGVYRSGEIYRRFPQRLSSLAFGTRPGRFLTRFVAIPYGGAYLVYEFVKHLAEMFSDHDHAAHAARTAATVYSQSAITVATVAVLGTFFLALLHVEAVARFCQRALRSAYSLLRGLFVDLPAWILDQPLVREVLESRVFQVFRRFVLKPAVFTALLLAIWRMPVAGAERPAANALGIFIIVNLVLNSRLGRDVDEVVTDWTVRAWHQFRLRVLSELARFVIDLFQRILQSVERVLYMVDEWLRFKSGEARWLFGLKATLGIAWFFVTYLIRFCLTLLIEPQVNPIKHFPVVTVSHKILIPMTPLVSAALEEVFDKRTAVALAFGIIAAVPGVFGYLVWELKENWRLYAANRPRKLRPIPIGHHAETMIQLMRPGFHFGTLPKRYARLRRADRRAWWSGQWKASRRQRELIHEDETTVRQFIERELVRLLELSRGFGMRRLAVGHVAAGTDSIRIELSNRDVDPRAARLAFTEESGLLLAEVEEPGWIEKLDDHALAAFRSALLGVYKLAGVDLVREEIAAALGGNRVPYNIADNGLVVWLEDGFRVELVYSLAEPFALAPRITSGMLRTPPPDLDARSLYLSRVAITWDEWVTTWDRDRAAEVVDLAASYHVRLLGFERETEAPASHTPRGEAAQSA